MQVKAVVSRALGEDRRAGPCVTLLGFATHRALRFEWRRIYVGSGRSALSGVRS